MDEIINKVSASTLVQFDLEAYYTPGERVVFDLKDHLYQGMILREKDFRDFIKSNDWKKYEGKIVAIVCSAEAIVPTWAYMLLSVVLEPVAAKVFFGSVGELESQLFHDVLVKLDWEQYRGAKVVIKGCSKIEVPASAYVEATNYLRPLVASMMYGEPCSTVPLYKRPKT